MTNESDRILTLEINFKNFMDNVSEKFDAIMKKLDDMPITYATKQEVNDIKQEVKNISTIDKNKTVEFMKIWGGWISTIIAGAIAYFTMYNK